LSRSVARIANRERVGGEFAGLAAKVVAGTGEDRIESFDPLDDGRESDCMSDRRRILVVQIQIVDEGAGQCVSRARTIGQIGVDILESQRHADRISSITEGSQFPRS